MCWMSWNLGASTSWNPCGLSRDCFTFSYFTRMLIIYFMTLRYRSENQGLFCSRGRGIPFCNHTTDKWNRHTGQQLSLISLRFHEDGRAWQSLYISTYRSSPSPSKTTTLFLSSLKSHSGPYRYVYHSNFVVPCKWFSRLCSSATVHYKSVYNTVHWCTHIL